MVARPRYHDVLDDLRISYDGNADTRDGFTKEPWRLAERTAFAERLQKDGCQRLLEIGAGTGQDSEFLAEIGLDVVATDLSAANVAKCREKGIDARVVDVLSLDFPAGSFDAAYSVNCLLHVPNADLPDVLRRIAELLRPGGLFYLAVWGGRSFEGTLESDRLVPPRFFSFRTDDQILDAVREEFEVVDFHTLKPGEWPFQSLTLRRPLRI